MSKTEINFLDTTVFKVDNKLLTKVYVKPTDRKRCLHSKSEHPNSTKRIIAYSQALRFNKICYSKSHLHNKCKQLLNTLTKRGYNKTGTATQNNGANSIPRKELLNKVKTSNTERLPLTVTCNRALPDLKTVIGKNWRILQIEPKLKEIFAEPPILAFNGNENLKDIIEGNKVFDYKKILNVKKFNKAKWQPCFTRSINLCKKLKTCSTFQNAFNKNTFLIRHNVTCKSSCVIYLMEFSLCEKSQHVGKSEYSLNLRMNIEIMFGEKMVHRVTSISKCQVIILILTVSLLSLKRFIVERSYPHFLDQPPPPPPPPPFSKIPHFEKLKMSPQENKSTE